MQQARCVFGAGGERRPRQAGIDRNREDELDLRSMVEDLMSDHIHGVKKRASKMTSRHKPSPRAAMAENVLYKKGRVKKKGPEPVRVVQHGSGLL